MYSNSGARLPEPSVEAQPQGVSEGLLPGRTASLCVILANGRLHQLDEHVAQLILPPAVQTLRIRSRPSVGIPRELQIDIHVLVPDAGLDVVLYMFCCDSSFQNWGNSYDCHQAAL